MTELKLEDAVNRYVDLRAHTLRPSTIKGYRCTLGRLLRFLHQSHPPITNLHQLTRLQIEDWLRHLATRQPPLKNSSRRLHIIFCRKFLQDVSEWGWIDAPLDDLLPTSDLPPLNRQLPKPLAPDVDALLQNALQVQDKLWAKGLLLARWTGLRIGELTHLERRCLIRTPGQGDSVRVPLGKLRNERLIPVDEQTVRLIELLREQSAQRPSTIDPETGQPVKLLLCKPDGKPLSTDRFRRPLNRLVCKLGLSERIHPHRLRHTYATELLRFGVSLPGVMKLLGHRTPRMTLRYVEVNQDDLRQSYLRAIREARSRYPSVAKTIDRKSQPEPSNTLDDLDCAFTDLVVRIQAVRFNHPDPAKRKKLQRLVERMRRAQNELPVLLS